MALNVKAALALCMTFVAGMSWVLQGIATPERVLRSPLHFGTAVAAQPEAAPESLSDVEVARADFSFSQPNALQRERERQPRPEPRVLSQPIAVPVMLETPRLAVEELPPLMRDAAQPMDVARVDAETSAPVVAHEREAAPQPPVERRTPPDPAGRDEPALAVHEYKVAPGDTLMRILRREWDTSDERVLQLVLMLNPSVRARQDRILVGETLLLPDAEAVALSLAPSVSLGELVTLERELGGATAPAEPEFQWYTIQKRDSLTKIAQRFLDDGRRWREILALNEDLDPDKLFPGMRIKVPATVRVATR